MAEEQRPSKVSNRVRSGVRWAIRYSPDSNAAVAKRYGLNPKTVAKWRARGDVDDRVSGPSSGITRSMPIALEVRSIVLRFLFRLSLDECLAQLRQTMPSLTRSALYRTFRRHRLARTTKLLDYTHSKYRHAAIEQPGCFLGNIFSARVGNSRIVILTLVDVLSRWTFLRVLERLDVENITAAFDTCYSVFPFPMKWLFADTGSYMSLYRPLGIEHGREVESYLFAKYRIRSASVHSGLFRIHDALVSEIEMEIAKATRQNYDFELQAFVTEFAQTLNRTFAMAALGGKTPSAFLSSVGNS